MPNYPTIPSTDPTFQDVALYHAMPYGLRDGMKNLIQPELYVDVSSVLDEKTKMLSFHASQKEWLDKSQGLDAYLITMRNMSQELGSMSGIYRYAEGWRRHLHLGFSGKPDFDPLSELLKDSIHPA